MMKAQTPASIQAGTCAVITKQPVRVTVARPRTANNHFTSIILRMKLVCPATIR